MYYLDSNTIFNSFCKIKDITTNKFWGILSVLKAIKTDNIQSCTSYQLDGLEISNYLESTFYFSSDKKTYDHHNWWVILSSSWINNVSANFLKETPNLYYVAFFALRNYGFDKKPELSDILKLFIKEFHLSDIQIETWFDKSSKNIEFNILEQEPDKTIILKLIKKEFNIEKDNKTLTFESPYNVSAHPGELTRAPFIQTLYSGQQNLECLLLTQFDTNRYYQFKTNKPSIIYNNRFSIESIYRKYFIAIKTKPFILLAGISGTGKSRIVRELAQMTCTNNELKDSQKPGNFEMIQVRPNWHDSTELMGYVTRISGTPQYITTKFLRFLVKAWIYNDIPFFLCLDEMNLAPVEQYFAEYLSVIETRKCFDGKIVTDPIIIPKSDGMTTEVYVELIKELLTDCPIDKIYALTKQFEDKGISIPQNLVVMGTVNMDETTYSFSRKVLDRAMTIEMNHVELDMNDQTETDILIDSAYVIGNYARDEDVYTTEENKKYCDQVIGYLKKVNGKLDKTPFKIAYRTRNEFMIYCINALEMTNGDNKETILTKSLDEMTSMKILSRIEGDRNRTESVLDELIKLFEEQEFEEGGESRTKVLEMKDKLANGYTSYWS